MSILPIGEGNDFGVMKRLYRFITPKSLFFENWDNVRAMPAHYPNFQNITNTV
jgi:hypothetical protein